MKKILLFASVLLLSACTMDNVQVSNPFASTTNVQSVYTSQFSDVPVPIEMKSDPEATITTISASGQKVGKETLKGRVEFNSLGAAMARNLNNQGWVLVGIVQGAPTVQLYAKDSRYLIVTIADGTVNATLTLYMITQVTDQSSFFGSLQNAIGVAQSPENTNAYSGQNQNPIDMVQEQSSVQSTPLSAQTVPVETVPVQNTNVTEPSSVQDTSQNTNFDSFGSDSLFQ